MFWGADVLLRTFGVDACLLAVGSALADPICREPPNGPENEKLVMAQVGGRAMRVSDGLQIKTRSGLVKLRNTDCEEGPADECRTYKLAGHIRDHDLFVVEVHYYEGGAYLLIDGRTGRETWIPGFPWVSPDNGRFVTMAGEGVYDSNVIAVWTLGRAGPKREWRFEPGTTAAGETTYCFQDWISPDQVALRETLWVAEGVRGEEDGIKLGEFGARLSRVGSAWTIRRAAP